MSIQNSIRLLGNAGNDPVVKELSGGKKVASFSVATNEKYTDMHGEKVEDTQWHTCIAYGKTAEFIEKFITKGSEVLVQGRMKYRQYEDKEKIVRNVAEIIVEEFRVLSK